MMELVQLRDKSQITLPAKIQKELGIKKGDYLEVSIEDDRIILIPKVLVDKKEITLSKAGEKYLQEALNDIKEGKIKSFDKTEDLMDDLKK